MPVIMTGMDVTVQLYHDVLGRCAEKIGRTDLSRPVNNAQIELKEMTENEISLIINSKDSETMWNSFRFASAALSKGQRVSVFLPGPAVTRDSVDNSRFEVH